jgi:hypothetical protein
MALITIEPDWAKLLDFETTLPKAIEDLARKRQAASNADQPRQSPPTLLDP